MKARVINPDDVGVEITRTMTLFQWKKLRDACSEKLPGHVWVRDLDKIIRDIEDKVYFKDEE